MYSKHVLHDCKSTVSLFGCVFPRTLRDVLQFDNTIVPKTCFTGKLLRVVSNKIIFIGRYKPNRRRAKNHGKRGNKALEEKH